MLGLTTSVIIHRVGSLDLTSMTERTHAVTDDPSRVIRVF
jgi:hypothetical protein